jgi:hypothetical protein
VQFIALLTCLYVPGFIAAQRPPSCDQQRVTYQPHKPTESQFRIERVPPTSKPQSGTLNKSPQGTRWFAQDNPDYTRNGPWNTTIVIGDHQGASMKLTFPNHGNSGVQADWLSEKLLFTRVWLGRIVSLDLILDVEKGMLIYSEEANYGGLIEPCE